MSSDDLAIFLFLMGTAIAFGLTAVTLADWKRRTVVVVMFGVAIIFAISALVWPAGTVYLPTVAAAIKFLAGTPFVLKSIAAAIFILICIDFAFRLRSSYEARGSGG